MKRLIPLILLAGACAGPPPAQNDAGNQAQEQSPRTQEQKVVPEPPPPPLPGGSCDAAPAEKFIGQQRSDALGEEAKVLTGSRTLRWIGPNQAVTMDYSPTRLNIEYDAAGKITALRCG